MRAAMEELRLGIGDGGKLYRRTMHRKGIFGGVRKEQMGEVAASLEDGGIPLEYARGQVDGPSKKGWDEGWVRG